MLLKIPIEVEENLEWKTGKEIDALEVYFYLNTDFTKFDAWKMAVIAKGFSQSNRLQKAHTDNYWVWYCHA